MYKKTLDKKIMLYYQHYIETIRPTEHQSTPTKDKNPSAKITVLLNKRCETSV